VLQKLKFVQVPEYNQRSEDSRLMESSRKVTDFVPPPEPSGVGEYSQRSEIGQNQVVESAEDVVTEPTSPQASVILCEPNDSNMGDSTPIKARYGVPVWFAGKVSPAFEQHIFWPSPPKKQNQRKRSEIFPACASTKEWRALYRQKKEKGVKSSSRKTISVDDVTLGKGAQKKKTVRRCSLPAVVELSNDVIEGETCTNITELGGDFQNSTAGNSDMLNATTGTKSVKRGVRPTRHQQASKRNSSKSNDSHAQHKAKTLKRKSIDNISNVKEKCRRVVMKRDANNNKKTSQVSSATNDDRDTDCLFCQELFKDSTDTQWIQCQECMKWAHTLCAGVDDNDNSFVCDLCK